jgi:hypothetical protein
MHGPVPSLMHDINFFFEFIEYETMTMMMMMIMISRAFRDFGQVMIALNFLLFLLVAAGQALIYRSLRVNAASGVRRSDAQDRTVARRLLAVVMTDFACWFPIGLLGIMAR